MVYVDSQARFRVISFDAKVVHDDSQAKPRVYVPPKVGDTVFVRGKAVVIPELDAEGRIVPDYGF